MSDCLLVICNFPDRPAAEKAAQILVEKSLAACVNILAECVSIYRWEGALESAVEVPVLIKTTRTAYPKLETILQELHSYAIPEIIAMPIEAGLPVYLNWILSSTQNFTKA